MTPCEKLGYKVGDKFEVRSKQFFFNCREIVKLRRDDGSENPFFTNSRSEVEYPNGVAMFLKDVRPLTTKLRPAKQALADAIHASGKGWSDGANWAAQDKKDLRVTFYKGSKPVHHKGDDYYTAGVESIWLPTESDFNADKLLPNWHQTVLSRDEYFSAHPEASEPVADETESLEDVLAPDTADTLLTTWQSAQATAREARIALEAAEQAEREAEEAVKAALGKYGWSESVVESVSGQPVVTDWRDLQIDDEVKCVRSNIGKYSGSIGRVLRIDAEDESTPVCVELAGIGPIWCHDVMFIRRP